MRQINGIVIHCSATKENVDFDIEDVKRSHLKRGFSDVGYHFYIRKSGIIEIGRPLQKMGAHVRGHNEDTIAICYEGGLDVNGKPKDTRTEQQKGSMHIILLFLLSCFPMVDISGHRDFSKDLDGDGVIEKHEWMKSCPCFDVKEEYGNLR